VSGDLAVNAVSQAPIGALTAGQAGAGARASGPGAGHGSITASSAAAGSAGTTGNAAANATAAPGSEKPTTSLYTNPVSELDPALGLVVLTFYNSQGVQTASIPTQKQLESYRLHGDAGVTKGGFAASATGSAAAASAISSSGGTAQPPGIKATAPATGNGAR